MGCGDGGMGCPYVCVCACVCSCTVSVCMFTCTVVGCTPWQEVGLQQSNVRVMSPDEWRPHLKAKCLLASLMH